MRALPATALALCLALAGLAAPHAAFAQAGEPAATAPAATAAPAASESDEEEEITCERESITGSRVKKRTVCMTESQRKTEREQTAQALGGLRSNQTSNGN